MLAHKIFSYRFLLTDITLFSYHLKNLLNFKENYYCFLHAQGMNLEWETT